MELLPQTVWVIGCVFARVGALMMLAPGIGDSFVPARARLMVSLFLAILIAPIVSRSVPALPAESTEMALLLIKEIVIGLSLGLGTRILFSALATAGAIAGFQTGLSMATAFDPSQNSQGAVFGTLLSLLGTALIFETNTHHWFLTGAVSSYTNFVPGAPLPLGEIAQFTLKAFSQAFSLAIQMTAPLLIYGIVINIAMGIVNRIAPAIQVFFIGQPIQVLLGIMLFTVTAGAGMLVWLEAIAAAGKSLN
jgi:flagellar biosynthesis protein FliR